MALNITIIKQQDSIPRSTGQQKSHTACFSTLKVEETCFCEVVISARISICYTPEDINLHSHYCEILKSHMGKCVIVNRLIQHYLVS